MSACKTPWWGNTRHQWGPWKDKEEGNMVLTETKAVIGKVVVQERRCLNADCNMLELRTEYSNKEVV